MGDSPLVALLNKKETTMKFLSALLVSAAFLLPVGFSAAPAQAATHSAQTSATCHARHKAHKKSHHKGHGRHKHHKK
jgi:hypothetical protein